MIDRCVEWNPIPKHANSYPDLSVLQFQVSRDSKGRLMVSILVCGLKQGSRSYRSGADAWLITFEYIRAFRYRVIPQGAGEPPLIRPRGLKQAAWEVDLSTWAAQTGAFPTLAMKHFVIADEDMAYEILAADWKSEQLPDDWQQQYYISL